MDILKKHYEKIVLGGVLLVLAVSAAMLPVVIGNERDNLKAQREQKSIQSSKPLEPLNFSTQQVVVQRVQAGVTLDLSSRHKGFNPVFWQKTPDGRPFKNATGEESGPKALTVTEHTPLYLTITLDSINPGEGTTTPTRYIIGVEREAAAEVSKRRKKQYYATVGNKNDAFLLRGIKGPPENPDNLILELTDSGEEVIVKKGEAFKRVDGYSVDLKYDLEKKNWNNQRVGNALRFGSDDYNIVAITKNEVVVLAKSNQKKTPIPIP